MKPPVTSDCSLAPNLLFVDWLKILADEKQAVQFRSPLVLVCEQNGVHTFLVLNCMLDSLVNTHHLQQYSPFSLHYWSSWIMSDTTLRIHTLEDFVLVDIAEQPLFDLALWNMYDQTIGDLLRTNNAVEGWHRRFQANVGAYHPNFWKFIDILKREQSLNHVNISQARAGHQPEPQRRRYQDSNRRIKNIVQDYHNMDRLQYLRGLAHNINM